MINTYKYKFTRLQEEIFRLLCIKSGSVLNQRQIAKLLNVSPPAVANSISELQKSGLIMYKKDIGINLTQISLNRDNKLALQFKRTENLRQIYESGLSEYLENEFPGATIILFGSYSRGEDIVDSDIDIAVIGRKEKEIDLKKYEKEMERKININYYDSFRKIHKHLKENLCNGIILSGGVEL